MADSDDRPKDVRQQGYRLAQGPSQNISNLPPRGGHEDIPTLVHQLQVQHVQLEMQNEELRQTQEALAESNEHYAQLYDFSPASYVTLNSQGIIEEANLRFCAVVGLNRQFIVQRPLTDFVASEDHQTLQRHCQDVLDSGTTHTCKLRVLLQTGRALIMHVESLRVMDHDNAESKLQSAMLDITDMEQAHQTVHDSKLKLQAMAAKLLTAQDEERRRIARELHDDYCQRLTALILDIGLMVKRHPEGWTDATHLQPLKARLVNLLTDLRKLSHNLHPDPIISITLDDALRTLVTDFSEKTNIIASYHSALQSASVLPIISTCLYRVTQEGLTNIRLHSNAKRASVTVNNLPHAIGLLIKDDGCGFLPDQMSGSHHLGLTSMRERVKQLKGTLHINSRPDWGTTIVIQIPWRQLQPAESIKS